MQRIACVASVFALLLTACAPKQQVVQSAPPPLLATKAATTYVRRPLPPPPLPLPPKPAPPPVIVQKPHRGTRTLAATLPSHLQPRAGLQRGRWQVIVVHHTATDGGTVASLDRQHRVENGWENGLGYHFLIGNGVDVPDGKIFKGPRWDRQITGAHCKTSAGRFFNRYRGSNFFNRNGIGICLIGNFESGRPTAKQMASLQQLTAALCNDLKISPQSVYGHGQVTKRTACPGRRLSSELASLRSQVSGRIACSGDHHDTHAGSFTSSHGLLAAQLLTEPMVALCESALVVEALVDAVQHVGPLTAHYAEAVGTPGLEDPS